MTGCIVQVENDHTTLTFHSSIKRKNPLFHYSTGRPGFLLDRQLAGRELRFRCRKGLGPADFPITTGFSISPVMLPQINNVSISLDSLPPVHLSPRTVSVFEGNTLKTNLFHHHYTHF